MPSDRPRTTGRRSFLAALGTAAVASTAGCSAVEDRIALHSHRADADLSGPDAPWPTLGADARRTNRGSGSLPEDAEARVLGDVGAYFDRQPILGPDGIYAVVNRMDPGGSREYRRDEQFEGLLSCGYDGRERWRFAGENGYTLPTVAGNAVFVQNGDALVALDRRDGSRRWRVGLGYGYWKTAPAVVRGAAGSAESSGDVVYAVGDRLVALALDARTGERRWRTRLDTDFYAGIAATDDALYVLTDVGGENAGGVVALDAADGSTVWASEAFTGPTAAGGWAASPTVAGGRLYALHDARGLLAFRAADGERLWSRSANPGDRAMVAVADGTVYLADRGHRGQIADRLRALDAETGDVRWTAEVGDGTADCTPAVADDAVYVADPAEGSLRALDAETGDPRGSWSLPMRPSTGASIGDGVAAIGAENEYESRLLVLR